MNSIQQIIGYNNELITTYSHFSREIGIFYRPLLGSQGNIFEKFEISAYQLDTPARCGEYVFYEYPMLSDRIKSRNPSLKKENIIYSKINLQEKFRGIGLSDILLKESLWHLQHHDFVHVVRFVSSDGERIMKPKYEQLRYHPLDDELPALHRHLREF